MVTTVEEVTEFTAKELLSMDRRLVNNLPEGSYAITYDDGVCIHHTRPQVIFNRHIWEMFKLFPNTPIVPEYDVKTYLGDRYFNANTHVDLLNKIFLYIVEYNNLYSYSSKEGLTELAYIITNNIYNEIVQAAGAYSTTIDAIDFVEVVKSEQIRRVNDNLAPTTEAVENAYSNIRSFVSNKNTKNRLTDAYRSGSINDNQANQCIGPRGFVSDMDRSVFKLPILNGYIRGMGSLYEALTESVVAAKALNASDAHIATSEYTSRKGQILAMFMTRVIHGDCGSQKYATVSMSEKYLLNCKGMWYKDQESGTLKMIKGNEKHLVDTIVNLRTALGCTLTHNSKLCSVCGGDIFSNIKENSNIGYSLMAYIMEKMSQGILSVKHLTHSVKKQVMRLTGLGPKWMYADTENKLRFHKDIDLRGIQVVLPNSKVSKLVDVLSLDHSNIALNKIGELDQILIRNVRGKTHTQETVAVSHKDRNSIITKQLLLYIKNNQEVKTDTRGNFVIPMDNWNKEDPIFYTPLKDANLVGFVYKLSSYIETNSAKIKDPYEKLYTVFDEIIDQFGCNMSLVAVLINSICAANPLGGDYRLPRNSPNAMPDNAKSELLKRRSLSGLLCLEDQMEGIIKRPYVVFKKGPRQNHPMDVLFVPGSEVDKHN